MWPFNVSLREAEKGVVFKKIKIKKMRKKILMNYWFDQIQYNKSAIRKERTNKK